MADDIDSAVDDVLAGVIDDYYRADLAGYHMATWEPNPEFVFLEDRPKYKSHIKGRYGWQR